MSPSRHAIIMFDAFIIIFCIWLQNHNILSEINIFPEAIVQALST